MPRTLQIAASLVYLDADAAYVRTTFPGGLYLEARPQPGQEETAALLGYGDDVARLTLDHDLAHSVICAELLGLPASPTLLHEAGGEQVSVEWRALEEALVMFAQRCVNGLDVAPGSLAAVVGVLRGVYSHARGREGDDGSRHDVTGEG